MRYMGAALIHLVIVSTAWSQEPTERFPYSAFVATDEASVRSGPSETFYPVLALRHGDAVEVWRHDPAGWCAIRPPEGSFSWVAAEFIEQTGEHAGVVRGNQVNARVGTHFSDLRDAVQVKLDEGETVDIIERRTLLTAGRETSWYKIHPPAGEFRWIHGKHLVRHPDELPKPRHPELAAGAGGGAAIVDGNVRQASFTEDAAEMFAGQAAAQRRPVDALASLQAVPEDAAASDVLDELETVLSRMVAAEPTAWNFAELQRRADGLLETAATAGERSRARAFLGKLARFQDIQSRYAAIAHLRSETAEIDRQLADDAPSLEVIAASADMPAGPNLQTAAVPAAATTSSAVKSPEKRPVPLVEQAGLDTSRYDGTGRLTQLPAGPAGAMTGYALTNDRGEIQAYVTAAPGMNLRPFVGLDVGINGIRGFLPDKQVVQLTAKRVDVLRH